MNKPHPKHQDLIDRLNWPAPPHSKEDDWVCLPIWVLELCAEAASALAKKED